MSHDSILSKAFALYEEHIQNWFPQVGSSHPYWTRFEKKRVFTAIRDRDMAFVRLYMNRATNANSYLERVEESIIMLTYLTQAHFLFQHEKFRDTIWNKICEFEDSANKTLERINRIKNREEYEKEATLLNHLYDLHHVIWDLRKILRDSNDDTFYQG